MVIVLLNVIKDILDQQRLIHCRAITPKQRKILKWKPKNNIDALIDDMVSYELKLLNSVK